MFGRLYQIHQIYSFVNRTEIDEILKHDQIGKVIIDETGILKTIEYEMDNQLCIRLNDLLYQIVNIIFSQECKLVVIHLAQLLILISKLIKRVIDLEQNNLKHDYLDINRIWLKLKNGSTGFSILYAQTDYVIHFTGYQCPIYEQGQGFRQNMNKSMQQMIIKLIGRCQDKIQLKNNSQALKDQVQNEIYQPLIESCQKQSLLETLILIGQKLSYCNFNNQTIPSFDMIDVGFFRNQRFGQVQNEMHTIIKNQPNQDPLNLEWTYFFAVPFLANKIKENLLYSNAEFNYAQVEQVYDEMKNIAKNALEQDCFALNLIRSEVQLKFLIIEKQFKFSIMKVQQDKIEFEIYEKLLNHKILNYFYNSIWMYLNDRLDYSRHICSFVCKLLIPLIEDRFNLFIYDKLVELVNQLL